MLDKNVPYFDVLMHRKKGTPISDDELEAFIYFQKYYLPFLSELERRCLFIENEKGEKIATSTAWWNYTGSRRDPWLHWVAVSPKYQNMGLGKAVVSEALQLMLDIEGDRDFYLHTQTWSHRAIKIYEKLGYVITNEKNLYKYSNENYDKAMEVLNKIYTEI